ncbi:MAG: hypothetical protein KQ78_01936 [Candidatus Izimaplasma bacterium HR2]|nr:MAG: hypothetical protein KQ78_01936 [Candidatus Izimaplasma bacterium HR2]
MDWSTGFSKAIFINGKGEKVTFSEMEQEILDIIAERPDLEYVLSVGTDSQVKPKADATKFVTVVHLHRVGQGA